jgi:hypothetical protein
MSDWPRISVLIPTYNRTQIVANTVTAMHQLLVYPGQITYWLGVDNDSESAAEVSGLVINQSGAKVNAINGPRRLSHGKKHSLGANLNLLLTASHEDMIIMQMDDDHLLLRKLDLREHVEKLIQDPSCGWIRLMGVGFHRYCGCLDGRYWRIAWNSPEVYIPSNRPHIKHRRFHTHYGNYPMGLKLGETEEAFCHQCKDIALRNDNGPSVMVPIDVPTESTWDHIGTSFQNTFADQ